MGKGKMAAKSRGCRHLWEIIDKWVDKDGQPNFEFYCKHCRRVEVFTELKKRVKL